MKKDVLFENFSAFKVENSKEVLGGAAISYVKNGKEYVSGNNCSYQKYDVYVDGKYSYSTTKCVDFGGIYTS